MNRKEFLDKYGYYTLTVFITFGFGMSSIDWVISSPLLIPYFKISAILSYVVTPLIPPLLQILIVTMSKQYRRNDQKTKDDLKFLIFIFDILLVLMSLTMLFLPFNLVSYNIMRLLSVSILLLYSIIIFRIYIKKYFKIISIAYISTCIILFIISLFYTEIQYMASNFRWITDIFLLIFIAIFFSIIYYFDWRRSKNKE